MYLYAISSTANAPTPPRFGPRLSCSFRLPGTVRKQDQEWLNKGWSAHAFLCMDPGYMCMCIRPRFGASPPLREDTCKPNRACAGGCCVCALNSEAPNLSRAVNGGPYKAGCNKREVYMLLTPSQHELTQTLDMPLRTKRKRKRVYERRPPPSGLARRPLLRALRHGCVQHAQRTCRVDCFVCQTAAHADIQTWQHVSSRVV